MLKIIYTLGFLLMIYLHAYSADLPLISVQGNKFVYQNGTEFIFKAINASDPDRLEKEGQWNEGYFAAIRSWGANAVRFPVHPRAWRSRGSEDYMALIDEGIRLAEEQGMYVILDWHSIGNLRSELFQREAYNTTKRETFEFWRMMAKRYGSNTTVACFELFNEPTVYQGQLGTCTWEQWAEILEEIIVIIRVHGAENIPLVAGFNWAYDLTLVKDRPIRAEGIAYVSHPYPMKREKPWAEKWEADWGFVSDTYPLILTEIGYSEADSKGAHVPVISDSSYVEEIFAYTKRKGISFAIWVFDPRWSPMLIEDWTFKPTSEGAVWREALLGY